MAALLPGEGALLVGVGGGVAAAEAALCLWIFGGMGALLDRWRGRLRPRLGRDLPFSRRGYAALIAVTGLCLGLAEAGLHRPSSGKPPGARLWLVTLDTLRADHVSAIGGGRREVPTPNLDALAARCTLFSRGVSPDPLTLPAHAAMLTGQHPLETGVLRNGQTLDAAHATVATQAPAGDWRKAAFVSSAILAHNTGLDRGFERYDDLMGPFARLALLPQLKPLLRALELIETQRTGDQTLERVRRWLADDDGRETFLWVHLYDPHAPYAAPEGWRGLTPWDEAGAPGNPVEMRQVRAEIRRRRELFMPFVPPDLRRPVAAYADEVRWTDHLVGQLLDLVGGDRLILAADHGESLTEHGALLSHGSQVYEPAIRVPIIACLGWEDAPPRVETPVPLQAVGQTLLAELRDEGDESTGLRAYLDPTGPRPPLLSLAGEMQSRDQALTRHGWELALRDGEVKWVSGRDGTLARYLPASDPGEGADTAASRPEAEREAIARQFAEIRQKLDGLPASSARDPEQDSALRALGYVE